MSKRSASNTGSAFQPSKLFIDYLILVQASQRASEGEDWEKINTRREKVTKKLATREIQSINGLFEKIYVWRMESFDPSPYGYVYFDDLFPFSLYCDLKRMVGIKGSLSSYDSMFEQTIRSGKSD